MGCKHAGYCKHAPDRCREFLGNPLSVAAGGCPLAPWPEEIRELQKAIGGLSIAEVSEDGGLSLLPSDG